MTNKPVVNVLVCEKVLQEKDGVNSAIRIVDTFHIEARSDLIPPPPIPDDLTIPLAAFVALKSGEFVGEGEIALAIQTPDGNRQIFPQKLRMKFTGGVHGNNLVINFSIAAKHIGVTWIEVLWNSETISKFPIKLLLGQKQSSPN